MKTYQKYDPSQNRNMLIAMALAGLIMFAFEIFYNQPIRERQAAERKQAEIVAAAQKKDGQEALLKDIKEKEFTIPEPKSKEEIRQYFEARTKAIAKSPRVKIDNGSLHGSINLKGVRFDDATLANYKQSVEKDSPEVVMASPSGSYNSNFIETGWLSNSKDVAVPDSNTVWQIAEGENLTATTPVTLTWDNGAGVAFFKKISIDDKYMFTVEDTIINNSAAKISLTPFGLISKKRPQGIDDGAVGVPQHNGGITVFEDAIKEITFDKITEEKSISEKSSQNWLGVTDKYWLKAIIPSADHFDATFRYTGATTDKFQIDYVSDSVEIGAGEKEAFKNHIFIGAKKLKTLEAYADTYKIEHFDRAVNFGWIYFLCEPLYQLLLLFHSWVGNWGVAIIMLTVCVKAVLFPLSRKAYISMGKMKLIAPKIKEVQEKYKDNRSELSQHMMAVYKKEGVNPAAGCLPILIQIPFFIALYRLIYTSIELRHAPFFGWIHDLSAADPTSFWNLFGLLPYDAPTFFSVGVWPLVMCITMYLQQLLNPAPTDPFQAKFIKAMPLFFLFMFHSFPAGLMIYWSFSNSITFLQQLYFTRKLQHLKPNELGKFK